MWRCSFFWPIADAARCGRPSGCRLKIKPGRQAWPSPRRTGRWRKGREKSSPPCVAGRGCLPAAPETGGTGMRAFIFPGQDTALCAAGSFDLATTARRLKQRGQAMQAAVPVGEGAMAALLGADLAIAQAIADEAADGEVCTIANDNDPSQIVLSGDKKA